MISFIPQVSSAQKLINKLDQTEGLEYYKLTGSYNEAKESIRISKTRKSKEGNKTTADLTSVSDEAKQHVENVIKGLSLGNGEFLIVVAWVTAEGRLYHQKFPFLLGGDETFRTNAEKRPLARLCGKSLDNKVLPFVNAFLPSRQGWVFELLWGEVYPMLLCPNALSKTGNVKVDQDERNWNALIANQAPYRDIYGKGKASLCYFHKVRLCQCLCAHSHRRT